MSTLDYSSIFNAFFSDTSLWPAVLSWLETARLDLEWLESQLRDSPALAISLAAFIFVPLLAATGALCRLALPGALSRPPAQPAQRLAHASPTAAIEQRAFLEFQRHDVLPFEIRHAIVRIGRETDNDIKLDAPSVHRYHAIIERTAEGEFEIAYVGAPNGNGLRINGRKVHRQRLTGGEILALGAIKLRFTTLAA